MEFFYLFLYRTISGMQNGLGYAKNYKLPIATILMIVFSMVLMAFAIARPGPVAYRIAAATFAGIGMAAAIMVDQSFGNRGGALLFDIHFWESITTGAITVGVLLAGGNILLVAASVYPGLVMHKGFVNLGGGLPWWDHQTDDASGKTFSIPLLGIAVPRSPTRIRILLAAGSISLATITFAAGWEITLY